MRGRLRYLVILVAGIAAVCATVGPWVLVPCARAAEGSDWQHALIVARDLRAHPSDKPVVILIGGSAARECTVSDTSWAAAIEQGGGPSVVTYDLGSRNQTFEQEQALIGALPKIPIVVFIGVNRDRFTMPPMTDVSTTPVPTKGTYSQHHYTETDIKTLAGKQKDLRQWLKVRWAVFSARYPRNVSLLDDLVRECKDRGYQPVILDLPQDTAVIGGSLDGAVKQYQDGCRRIAAKYDIPFVSFVNDLDLANTDFFDLDHLVEPGRVKFQRKLVEVNIAILNNQPLPTFSTGFSRFLHASTTGARIAWVIILLAVALGAGLAVRRRRVVVRRRRRTQRRVLTQREPSVRHDALVARENQSGVPPGQTPEQTERAASLDNEADPFSTLG